ncbi:MAG: efflux transporter outer membrane subunit [Porticoccaceae bacterium]
MPIPIFRFISYTLSILLLSACTVGPDYQRPTTLADAKVGDNNSYHHADTPRTGDRSETYIATAWWQSIDDALLKAWVDQLLAQNLNLQATAERVIQAQQQVRITGGDLWPNAVFNGGGTRSFSPAPLASDSRKYNSSTDAGLSLSWQIDLFGKVRQAVASANYSALASVEDYRALQHSLIAELVKRRAEIALLQQELDIQDEIVSSRTQTLNTLSRRYQLGVRGVSVVDIYTAEENVASASANRSALEQQLHNTFLTVDALLNQLPGSASKTMTTLSWRSFPILSSIAAPAPGFPAALLDQRPDIRSDELLARAANANIGVAVANLLPDLTLSASRGFVNDQFGGLLDNNNALGSITGLITSRLFEGGRLRAGIKLRESETRERALRYAETVLNALVEVENALVNERYLREQVNHLERSVSFSRRAETQAQQRYQRGITPLLQLLDAQRRRQSVEQNLLAARRAAWRARVDLHLALGGDWLDPQAHGDS